MEEHDLLSFLEDRLIGLKVSDPLITCARSGQKKKKKKEKEREKQLDISHPWSK